MSARRHVAGPPGRVDLLPAFRVVREAPADLRPDPHTIGRTPESGVPQAAERGAVGRRLDVGDSVLAVAHGDGGAGTPSLLAARAAEAHADAQEAASEARDARRDAEAQAQRAERAEQLADVAAGRADALAAQLDRARADLMDAARRADAAEARAAAQARRDGRHRPPAGPR